MENLARIASRQKSTFAKACGHLKGMTFKWAALSLALSTSTLWAQATASVKTEQELVVRLKPGMNIASLQTGAQKILSSELLIPSMNLYLVKVKLGLDKNLALKQMRSNRAVSYAVTNHKVTRRNVDRDFDIDFPVLPEAPVEGAPNDPQFASLWNLHNTQTKADIRAISAWQYSTGGKNADGQDLVVAVVDGGVDVNHPDLKDNIWVNAKEIAANGLDDDGNGYVDDVNGWNAYDDDGAVPSDNHGTHVSGIIGARGNNQHQVAGINWNIKIMPVAASSGTLAIVAKGYGYVMAQKKLWLESQGAQGANVVVTNSSFGVDYADCSSEEFSVWNDLYNEMGNLGILSAAATANNRVDIDAVGDVPTGCTSPYIVAVTNTTRTDTLYSHAGWGSVSVDLGAPGTGILSTVKGGGTSSLTGTSMATPHVAGSVAFLHSVMNGAFSGLSKTDPAAAALEIKKILLETVDPIESLAGKTTSGGRLNLFRAAQRTANYSF